MSKPNANKKTKTTTRKKPVLETNALHDILSKVRSNQKQVDKKFEELTLMCSGNQCKVK